MGRILRFYQQSKFLKWLRGFVKKITPKPVLKFILSIYHSVNAFVARATNKATLEKINYLGVTGTNGKSTSMAMIAYALKGLKEDYAVTGSIFDEVNGSREYRDMKSASGSQNQNTPTMYDQITLINKIVGFYKKAKIKWMGIEFTSQGLDQKRGKGLRLKGLIITNLTQDHLDYHGTMQNYAKAKALVFKNNKPGFVVLNDDDEWADFFEKEAKTHGVKVYRIGKGVANHCSFSVKAGKNQKQRIKLRVGKEELELESGLVGGFNAYNLVGVITMLNLLGFKLKDLAELLAEFDSVPGRMEEIPNNRDLRIFVDYAHTPDAIEKTLQAIRVGLKKDARLWCVNGAAGERDGSKRPGIGAIMAKEADFSVVCDDEPHGDDPDEIRAEIISGFTKLKANNYLEIADRKKAIEYVLKKARPGDGVAILGLGSSTERAMKEGLVDWSDKDVTVELLTRLNKA
jgi:UDP-N-acetylmuramoyl-L-alanyl-D-glutamate--2,6-diaminopimelate ligase